MRPHTSSHVARWRYAAKPASWPKLLVPFGFGQAMGVADTGELGILAALVGGVATVLNLLFVVFLNDVADQEVDTIKRRMFPDGCSPKTLPDAILRRQQLVWGGGLAVCAYLGWSLVGAVWCERPYSFAVALSCVALFWAYSFPPIRLNYRGGGEMLEALGVGALLPVSNYYLQTGEFVGPSLLLLPGFICLSLASAVASGLADEVSDRAGCKTTVATHFGNRYARRFVRGCMGGSLVAWSLALGGRAAPLSPYAGVVVIVVLVVCVRSTLARAPDAVTNAFSAQAEYKLRLHRAIWWPTTLLSGFLLLAGWRG